MTSLHADDAYMYALTREKRLVITVIYLTISALTYTSGGSTLLLCSLYNF